MLRPTSTYQDMDADGLMAAVTARDAAIKVSKIKDIKVVGAHRQSVLIDDNPVPQPLDVVAKFLGAPASFLASSDLQLAQYIVDHQFKKVKDKKELVFRNSRVVGHQPTGSYRISGTQVVEALIKGVGEVRRANLAEFGGHVDITLVGDKVTMKPKVGDITEGGLRCLYSELLARPPQLEPYVERLVCANGMICRDRLDVFTFETMDKFLEQLNFSIEKSMKFVDTTIRAQLEKAVETKIDHSEQALRQIFESNRINPRLLSPTLAALTVEEDGSAFGVLQAITRAANTAGYSHRIAMQEIGAREMARLETVHCPTCWSTLTH